MLHLSFLVVATSWKLAFEPLLSSARVRRMLLGNRKQTDKRVRRTKNEQQFHTLDGARRNAEETA